MPPLAFDTLQAGFDAARKDLEAHQAATRAEFKLVRQEIAATEERLSAKIDAMENRVVVKLGKTIVTSISLACAVLTVVIAGVGLAVKYL